MALLPILVAPDKRLKLKAQPVERVDDNIRQLMDDMLETMYAAPGIGLAAPQVGVSKRIIVVDVSREDEELQPLKLANPEIIESEGEQVYEEGCLSVPEYVADVTRAELIKVSALNHEGQAIIIEATGLMAICLQHEIDHLNGTLFIDHISRLRRGLILKKLRKRKAEKG